MAVHTLYGTMTADTVLTVGKQFVADTTGGTETSQQCDMNGGNNVGEIVYFFTNPTSDFTAIQPPTGRGMVWNKPGAGTFAAGNWSLAYTWLGVGGDTVTLTWRLYRYSSGTYTAIGSVTSGSMVIPATKTLFNFPSLSGSSTVFGANDLLYSDIWLTDAGGAGGDNPTSFLGTSVGTGGVTNDMMVGTTNFTPAASPHLVIFDGLGGMFK